MIGALASLVQTGLGSWWAPALALAAGAVSFASPCVLPLVPGYLAFVAGRREVTAERPAAAIGPIVLFIAGFTVVFTLGFGFAASSIARFVHSLAGQRVAGAVIIAFGAFMLMYALRLGVPWLYREERPLLTRVRPGPAWAFPLGLAFAVGWTPCIGPVLAGILVLAAAQGSSSRAIFLLFMYSVGLGVPFLLVGLGVDRLMGAFRFVSRNYQWFAGVSGGVLVAIGVLLVTGVWVQLLSPVLQMVTNFSPAI